MQYSIVRTEEGESYITVFRKGAAPLVADSSHPNFQKITEGALAGDESVYDLFDIAQTAATKFERLTERVTTANGRLYLDGEEVHDTLAQQVVRFLDEGVEDWKPLVAFFENVQANPQEHSREQLYRWLKDRNFTITPDGLIVGYKGVTSGLDSIRSGQAIVDGEVVTGQIPNKIGSVIEMPRGDVQFDPSVGCHTGLHVGTHRYASGFAQGALLEVHVNPRDVVSVPTDCNDEKMRVCRYKVVGTIEQEYTAPVLDDGFGYDLVCEDCGSLVEDCECEEDEPVEDLEETVVPVQNYSSIAVGDVFEDRDSRRQGRSFKVESIEGDFAIGKSLPSNLTRKVRIDRLASRKYRKV